MKVAVGLITLYGNNGQTRLAIHLAECLNQLGIRTEIFDDSANPRRPFNRDWDTRLQYTDPEQLKNCQLVLWLAADDASLPRLIQRHTRVGAVIGDPASASAMRLASRLGLGVCLSKNSFANFQAHSPRAQHHFCPISGSLPIIEREPGDSSAVRVLLPGSQLSVGDLAWYAQAKLMLQAYPQLSLTIHRLPHWLTAGDRARLRQLRNLYGDRVRWSRSWTTQALMQHMLEHDVLLWHDPHAFTPEGIYAAHLGIPVIATSCKHSDYLLSAGTFQIQPPRQPSDTGIKLLQGLEGLLKSGRLWDTLKVRTVNTLKERQEAFRGGLQSLVRY